MTNDVIPPGVLALLKSGNKIEAIKELRGMTGLGLKEAKDWIDAYERGDAPPLPEPDPDYSARDPNASFTLSPRAIDALKRGNTIEAIKIVRETTGAGLAEAKAIVDEIQKHVPVKGKESARPGDHLAPGQVAESAGPGKWLVLLAVAAAVIVAVVLYR